MRLTRFTAVAGASVALVLATGIAAPAALADTYPSWDDVRKAKASQSATQSAAKRVAGLVTGLRAQSAAAQSAAADAGDTLQRAQSDFFVADQTYTRLTAVAADAAGDADVAATRAGRLAAQLYRTGGHNTSLALLLSSGEPTSAPGAARHGGGGAPTGLLEQLGTISRLTETSAQLWGDARQAKNAAAAASAQAKAALDERGRLQQEAQTALATAVQRSAAAQEAAAAEQAHSDELNAMLAALNDKTAKTVAAYEAGVRARAEEAKRKEREAQLAAQRAAEREATRGGESRPSQPVASASGWVVPVRGVITAGFGPRPAPCAGCSTWHEGVDIAAPFRTPIRAARSGTVVYAGPYGGYGNLILVDHGDAMSTAYGHNIDGGIVVRVGQRVSAGQVIGHVGSTGHSNGPHLHFEVRRNGVQINPIPWMAQHGAAL